MLEWNEKGIEKNIYSAVVVVAKYYNDKQDFANYVKWLELGAEHD